MAKEPWEKELARHDGSSQESPWQPMRTAPKDGTRVLISANGNVEIAYWTEHANFGGHNDDAPGWQVFLCDGDEWYSVAVEDSTVTGWMPAPVAMLRKRPTK